MYVNKADILPKEDLIKFMNDDYSFMYDDEIQKTQKRFGRAKFSRIKLVNFGKFLSIKLSEIILMDLLAHLYVIVIEFFNNFK